MCGKSVQITPRENMHALDWIYVPHLQDEDDYCVASPCRKSPLQSTTLTASKRTTPVEKNDIHIHSSTRTEF